MYQNIIGLFSTILILFFLISFSSAEEIDLVKSAKLISCGYYLSSQTPEQIADGNLSTYWSCGILHNQWGEHWLILDFGGLAELTRFKIRHIAYANLPETLNTREFAIELAQNQDGPWQEVHTVQNTAQENLNEYSFSQPIQTRYIRLHIIKPNYFGREDNFARVSEVEFWGRKIARANFNLITPVQAAIPTNTDLILPTESKPVKKQPKKSATTKMTTTPAEVKIDTSNASSSNWSTYLMYGAMAIGGLVGIIILGTLIRWIIAKQVTKKQLRQKEAGEQSRLLKKQEEERIKTEKQEKVAVKFQEYYDAGMKAMEEERYEDAAQAFYQAQGLRPDSTEAKSKLVYCKNLAKKQSGKANRAA